MGEVRPGSGWTIPVEARCAWLQTLPGNGYRGVGVFFVISGMILAMPFARHHLLGGKPVSLRRYYLRRVTRLEPPYVISIFVVVLMLFVYQHSLPLGFAGHVAANLFYLHTLVFGQMSTVNSVTWSLEVEIQFYPMAPLIMQLFRIRPVLLRRGMMLAAILAIGLAQAPFVSSLRFIMSILYYLQYFIAGLLVVDIFVLDLERMQSGWVWDVAGALVLALAFGMSSDHVQRRRDVLFHLSSACSGGAAVFKVTRRAILPQADFLTNYLVQVVTLVPLVLAVCITFYLLVERPCMDPEWPSKVRAFCLRRFAPEQSRLPVGIGQLSHERARGGAAVCRHSLRESDAGPAGNLVFDHRLYANKLLHGGSRNLGCFEGHGGRLQCFVNLPQRLKRHAADLWILVYDQFPKPRRERGRHNLSHRPGGRGTDIGCRVSRHRHNFFAGVFAAHDMQADQRIPHHAIIPVPNAVFKQIHGGRSIHAPKRLHGIGADALVRPL